MNAFTTNPRRTLTDQQKAKLFLQRGGKCHRCKRKLAPGDTWTVEHVIALENGGSNDWDNIDITCAWCLPAKNAEDHGKAAKARAVAVAHVVPRGERQKKGRPLPGTKRSGWKHKMNGEWVRR
jgi:5-methylcytosine-specific restriction protein A